MTTLLKDIFEAPLKHDVDQAAFNIYVHLVAQEPNGNAWTHARNAYSFADAFFDIRKEYRENAQA